MLNKTNIKSFLGILLRISRLPFLLREVILKNKNTIICYHKPDSEVFRAHLNYLVKNYNIIPLDVLVGAVFSQDWSSVPPKSLVITFDDGLKENYRLLEVIKEYKVPVTIYACSHIINTKRRFWFLTGLSDYQELKNVTNHARLAVLKEKVAFEQDKEYSQGQSLDIDQIIEMSEYVDFQSHSRFHPVLTRCSDRECLEEIKGSKECLEKILNHQIRHFAYPNGDYGLRERAYLRQAGYKSAVSMDYGWNDLHSNSFSLKRLGVADNASVNELIGEVSGIFGFLRKVLDLIIGDEE